VRKCVFIFLALAPPAFGAASITIVSATLNADGTTITMPMSGVTGSLSPSSGITGFTVSATQNEIRNPTIESVTASGTTITLMMTTPITMSDVATIALATVGGGSNLTDTGSNTPAGQTTVSINSSATTWYSAGAGTLFNASRIDGGISGNNTGQQAAIWQSGDGKYRFVATASQINICVFEDGTHWLLYQDGSLIKDWGQLTQGLIQTSTMTAVTGLTGTHTYEIIEVNSYQAALGDLLIYSVQVVGSIGAQPPAHPLIAEVGDSLVALQGNQDGTTGHLWLSSYQFGYTDIRVGASGAPVYQRLETNVLNYWTNLGQSPFLGIMRGGGNDIADDVTIPQFSAAWQVYITSAMGLAQPPTKLISLGIIASTIGTLAQNIQYNTVISTVSAANGVCYVDTWWWLGPLQDRQADNLHLNAAGESVFANNLIPITAGYVNGASYTVTGPSSGTKGSPSGVFTATLAGGATWTGNASSTETITLSDNGLGGTFTVAGGTTVGTDPITVTPTAGNSSFTFTYTPGTRDGTKTITATSGQQCWTDPISSQYFSPGITSILTGASKFSGSGILQ